MTTDNGVNPSAADGPRGVDALEMVATQAALIISRRAAAAPGDFVVIIRGTIQPNNVIDGIGWEWFWRPPSDRSPDPGPISTKDKETET